MITARKKELQATVKKALGEFEQIESAERKERNRALIGKCFKYHNSYSCPEKPADYWWLYARVAGLVEDGWLKVWTFEKNGYGKWEIEFDTTRYGAFENYTPIPLSEFLSQWKKAVKEIERSAQAHLGKGKK